jgi:hypothetical protein
VGVAAVLEGDHTPGAVVSEFVDDAVDADPVGPQPGEPSVWFVWHLTDTAAAPVPVS